MIPIKLRKNALPIVSAVSHRRQSPRIHDSFRESAFTQTPLAAGVGSDRFEQRLVGILQSVGEVDTISHRIFPSSRRSFRGDSGRYQSAIPRERAAGSQQACAPKRTARCRGCFVLSDALHTARCRPGAGRDGYDICGRLMPRAFCNASARVSGHCSIRCDGERQGVEPGIAARTGDGQDIREAGRRNSTDPSATSWRPRTRFSRPSSNPRCANADTVAGITRQLSPLPLCHGFAVAFAQHLGMRRTTSVG